MKLTIVKASRYFLVKPLTDEALRVCLHFQHRFRHEGFGTDKEPGPVKFYSVALHDNSEFRFHINTLQNFLNFIKERNYTESDYAITEKAFPFLKKRTIPVQKKWVDRDYQEKIIEYLVASMPPAKFIGIQTGKGKTYCSLRGVSENGYRTAIVVEGGLMKKWCEDVLKVLDIKPKNTLSVRGGNQLRGLIGMAGTKEYEKVDVVLISSNSLQDWITTHETLASKDNRDVGYGIEPGEFYEHMEIGHRLIDELHKRFHFNFKQDLYCNAPMVTSLSATLFSYDKVIENFYNIAYPMAERFNGGEIDKYAKSYAVMWRPQRGRKIKSSEYGRSTYSHIAVEKSIMRNKSLMDNYFEMIAETIDIGYVANYKKGNKVAVYVASTDMATALVKFLRKRFPTNTVERYVGSLNDPYGNLLDPDIRVTTLGSGGTGHDIPDLTDTILTVGIMSLQANIQVFGRLRFIPDQDTRFYYMTCLDLDAQMRYHGLKIKLMEERAKSFEILNYNTPL
jgi:hypothetical protein